MDSWWPVLATLAGGILLLWLALTATLWLVAPDQPWRLRQMLRLLPDVVRMLRGLATDPALPAGIRIRLWLLLGYLALPFDLIPDFVPVVGYVDDVIVVVLVLRAVVRAAGTQALERHWTGSDEGLAATRSLAGT